MSLSRRHFIQDSLLVAAAASLAGRPDSVAFAAEEKSKSPNEKLSVAVVGVKGRGGSHLGAYGGGGDTEITYICDVDEAIGQSRCDGVEKRQGRRPKYVKDMREIFDDKSVDIVTTATPNHWHALCAIWAIQAGKDVYVEKPVSHNVSEGRRIVEAARKYGRICQCGTQSRSNPGMREAIDYIHAGKLGDVKVARGLCYKRRGSIGETGTYEIPSGIDYNLWSGPAPILPLTRKNLHYDWHWMWAYGNGDLGNQGIHQMDIARWGLQVNDVGRGVLSYGGRVGYVDAGETANTQVSIHDYGDKRLVFEVRGLPTDAYRGAAVGVVFYGSEGALVSPNYNGGVVYDKNGKEIASFKAGDDRYHFENFIKAVRSRKPEDLNAEILDGHLSSALCHLGNISYRLGSPQSLDSIRDRLQGDEEALGTLDRVSQHLDKNNVDLGATPFVLGQKLTIDPTTETFVDASEEAAAMLTREYRAPFVVPAAGKV